MRNQEPLRVISETTQNPNNLDLDRDYLLSYVWDDDYFDRKSPSTSFSGKEILEAFRSIPEAIISSNKQPHEYKEHLHQLIKISGRVEMNKPLSNIHCPELIERAKRAKNNDDGYRDDLRKDMALFVALSLDEIAQSDADEASLLRQYSEDEVLINTLLSNPLSILYVNDCDENDPSHEAGEQLLMFTEADQVSNIQHNLHI